MESWTIYVFDGTYFKSPLKDDYCSLTGDERRGFESVHAEYLKLAIF